MNQHNALPESTPPAELVDWPELVPLDAPTLPRLAADCLPGWAGEFAAKLAESTETPPELPVGLTLSALSVATARRYRVEVGPGWYEPANLWVVVALPPGNRKSRIESETTAPLKDWEREQAQDAGEEITRTESKLETMRARAKELRGKAAKADDPTRRDALADEAEEIEASMPEVPVIPQLWTSDATPERLGTLLSQQGECMAWLSSEGGIFDTLAGRYSSGIPNLDLVLKAHAGDSDRVDRGSRPDVFLLSPRLTIGLSPQPSVLQGLTAKPGFRGRGLLGRFLYLLPPSPLGYRTLEAPPMPEHIRDAYQDGLRAMLDWPADADEEGIERPHLVKMTDEARAELLAFAKHIEREFRPGGYLEHLTDWGGKAAGAAARIAAVLHGAKHAHGEPWAARITAETMGEALEIMAVMVRHALAAMNLMGADPTVSAARRVWEWIEQRRLDAFREREAFNALRGTFPRMKDIRPAFETLEERGYIHIEEPERSGPGRKPSPWVYVRPDIVEGWR